MLTSSDSGWGSGRRSSLHHPARKPSRLWAGAKAPLKAAGQAEIFIFLAGWWRLRKQRRAVASGQSLPAPRLSVHTSGRAVLISHNLLIPALEFTNSCESTVWKQPHHQDGEAGAGLVKQLAGEGLRRSEELLLPRPLLQALPGSQPAPAQFCC